MDEDVLVLEIFISIILRFYDLIMMDGFMFVLRLGDVVV